MILGDWGRRAWYLLNRRRFERELAEEMAAHREMLGEPRRFGNTLRIREEARDAWVARWLDEAWQDLRYAARSLVRAPFFALSVVLILSVGIGLNLAVFQFINVVALRPPAVRTPETLVLFHRVSNTFRSSGIPYPATQFIREHNTVLSATLTRRDGRVTWESDAASRPRASYVSANWFAELGYNAALGRAFVESIDERVESPAVVVVSDGFWRTRLQAASDAVGRNVRINDHPVTIIGVAPPGFPDLEFNPRQTELWLLLTQIDRFNPGTDFKEAWGAHSTALYGRLRPGVSPAAARDSLRATMEELARVRPAEFKSGERLEPYPGSSGFRGPEDTEELILFGALVGGLTLVVLLVACANIGNLMLSHAMGRLRELGVCAALGASRWRIVRQQLVESFLLATLGTITGLVLATWAVRTFTVYAAFPRYLTLAPDARTFAAAAAIAVASTCVFGVGPAWMVTRRDLIGVMKEGGYNASRGLVRARFRLMLVGAQVMGCCVLLMVTGLMMRGLHGLLVADLGFEFERVAVLDAAPGQFGVRGQAARAYWEEVKRSIAARPGVAMVSLTSQAPLGDSVSTSFYSDAHRLSVTTANVEASFFELMGIPLIAGRNFRPDDDPRGVVIISRRLANEMYGTLSVLGKPFPTCAHCVQPRPGSEPARTIIGISEDASLLNPRATTVAEQYMPIDRDGYDNVLLLARAHGDPAQIVDPMRAAVRAADNRVVASTKLMRTSYEEKLRTRAFAGAGVGITGVLALTLACFGIFGVVSYGVATRTREIGIRRALGATGASVLTLVLQHLVIPVGVGMGLGVAAGLGAGWLLARDPLYLPSSDVLTPLLIVLFFAITAAAAAVWPASRALGVEPLRALRHE